MNTEHKMTNRIARNPLLKEAALIGGLWITSTDASGEVDVLDPSTRSVIGAVPNLGALETAQAIDAADACFAEWSTRTAAERAAVLERWYNLIIENTEHLAQLMTAEQGKPLAEARGEVAYGAGFIKWFAEEARRIRGELVPSPWSDRRIAVLRQPVGVVAAITPWNFPIAMITRKVGPALAAGCTCVVKPASATPFCALALASLALDAGLPAGALSVVTGSARKIGAELTRNPKVKKVTFTGSTEIGKTLMAQSASTIKKVSLELGGNAPFIVFDDADLDAAVAGVIASKFRNSGQTCVCTNRVLAQRNIAAEFTQKLEEAISKLVVGDGFDFETTQGPLIDDAAVAKVEEHIADAVAKGAKVVAGGKRADRGDGFFEPTLLANVSPDALVATEETFGPLAPVFLFDTEQEAIAMANATEFGLAAYFYSRDIGRIWRVLEALEFGMVGVNEGIISTEVAPFGGVKESGLGREGSQHGIDEYVEMKYACFGGLHA